MVYKYLCCEISHSLLAWRYKFVRDDVSQQVLRGLCRLAVKRNLINLVTDITDVPKAPPFEEPAWRPRMRDQWQDTRRK
jgi:hypothetical protein